VPAIYTRTNLNSSIAARIPAGSSTVDLDVLSNDAVREVLLDLDLRSTKRRSALSPNLFNDVYDYTWPSDAKNWAFIDLVTQINRIKEDTWDLVTPQEFDRRKAVEDKLVSFGNDDLNPLIRISKDIDDNALVASTLDSLTAGGGTWVLFGDGTNLTQDTDNFVKGGASINWDIDGSAGTTAGIQNTGLNTFDITEYTANGSIFSWVYITSTTDITNFIIRIGTDASNYFEDIITTDNAGNAFVTGWNLLRFDFNGASETGSVTLDTINFIAIFMTKATGKQNETDYRFDHIIIRRGEYYSLDYYSRFGWQTNANVFIEQATADTDLLNAETEEIQIIIQKAIALNLENIDKDKMRLADRAAKKYQQMVQTYLSQYPSERKVVNETYHTF